MYTCIFYHIYYIKIASVYSIYLMIFATNRHNSNETIKNWYIDTLVEHSLHYVTF